MTDSPQVIVLSSDQEVADHTSVMIADLIRSQPDVVLGLATGGSPVETYRRLIESHRRGDLDFRQVVSFNLDEYIGLSADHPQSFRHFMQSQLFDSINIQPGNAHVPDGRCANIESHVASFERQITEAGGIELQLLGIGRNGHIAFNEPGSAVNSRTREVSLTDETIRANSRFFDSIDEVPKTAITMGIGTILEARRIVLIATGKTKAAAVAAAIDGTMTADCPASWLQSHADVTFVVDEAAASELKD